MIIHFCQFHKLNLLHELENKVYFFLQHSSLSKKLILQSICFLHTVSQFYSVFMNSSVIKCPVIAQPIKKLETIIQAEWEKMVKKVFHLTSKHTFKLYLRVKESPCISILFFLEIFFNFSLKCETLRFLLNQLNFIFVFSQ